MFPNKHFFVSLFLSEVDRSKPPPVYSWDGRIKLCENDLRPLNSFQRAQQTNLQFLNSLGTGKTSYKQKSKIEEKHKEIKNEIQKSVKQLSNVKYLFFFLMSCGTFGYSVLTFLLFAVTFKLKSFFLFSHFQKLFLIL